MKTLDITMIIATVLASFYGGTGFFTIMGGNLALRRMSPRGFVEFWQHVDHYMGRRMPVFGPVLLASVLVNLILLWGSLAFWYMLFAFTTLVVDLVFTLATNHPLNRLIQSWNLNKLPGHVKDIQQKVIKAFEIRVWFMIGAFVFEVLALFTYK